MKALEIGVQAAILVVLVLHLTALRTQADESVRTSAADVERQAYEVHVRVVETVARLYPALTEVPAPLPESERESLLVLLRALARQANYPELEEFAWSHRERPAVERTGYRGWPTDGSERRRARERLDQALERAHERLGASVEGLRGGGGSDSGRVEDRPIGTEVAR